MSIDVEAFSVALRKNAKLASTRKCATFVRKALEAGGANTVGHPASAKDYGPLLLRNGYRQLSADKSNTYIPQKGDVAVIQPTTKGNSAGHIEGYDGKGWISDFVQTGFWPGASYRSEKPAYAIYRP